VPPPCKRKVADNNFEPSGSDLHERKPTFDVLRFDVAAILVSKMAP